MNLEEHLLQYYKPTLSEVFIGLEFEYCPDVFKKDSNGFKKYEPVIFNGIDNEFTINSLGRIYNLKELFDTSLIRVRKLNINDILSVGFVLKENRYITNDGIYDLEDDCTGNEFEIMFNKDLVSIYKYTISFGKPYIPYEGDGGCIFKGTLKNKSELIRVMTLVGCPQGIR